MSQPHDAFLSEWHRIVAEKDLPALAKVLSEDISMGAPPYWQKLSGRPLVHHLLGLIIHTIEDFTYHREWQMKGELALEFKGHVGELQVQGIDLIRLDETGQQIHGLDVLMRPLGTIEALRDIVTPQMTAYLAEAGSRSRDVP